MALTMLLHPLFAGWASAAVIYSQDFDSLSTGNLNGQDSWTMGAGTNDMYQVVNDVYYSAPNSFRFSASGSNVISRTFTTIDGDAYLTAWFNYSSVSDNQASLAFTFVGGSGGYPSIILNSNGFIQNSSSFCYPHIGTTRIYIDDGNWHKLKVEYRDSDGFIRVGIAGYTCGTIADGDAGTEFAAWADPTPQTITSIAGIAFNYGYGENVYIDNLEIGTGSIAPEIPPNVYSINITSPVNGTTTADFNAWGLDYVFYTGTTTKTIFDIVVNTYPTATSTSIWYQDRIKLYDFIPNSTTTRSTTLNKQFAFQSAKTWYSKAFLIQGFTGDIFASSSQISYTISTSTAGIWYAPPSSASTSAEFVMTCDPEDNAFQRSLCYLFQYLFVPKYSDLDVFADLKNAIQTKPPFGYLTAALNALGDITATTTPEVELDVVPGLGAQVKPVLTIILWVLALLHIFNRLRYFKL